MLGDGFALLEVSLISVRFSSLCQLVPFKGRRDGPAAGAGEALRFSDVASRGPRM